MCDLVIILSKIQLAGALPKYICMHYKLTIQAKDYKPSYNTFAPDICIYSREL